MYSNSKKKKSAKAVKKSHMISKQHQGCNSAVFRRHWQWLVSCCTVTAGLSAVEAHDGQRPRDTGRTDQIHNPSSHINADISSPKSIHKRSQRFLRAGENNDWHTKHYSLLWHVQADIEGDLMCGFIIIKEKKKKSPSAHLISAALHESASVTLMIWL